MDLINNLLYELCAFFQCLIDALRSAGDIWGARFETVQGLCNAYLVHMEKFITTLKQLANELPT